jgi:hypothetical protein
MMNEISEEELAALSDFSWLRLPPMDEPAASPAAAATPPALTPLVAVPDQPAATAHQETPAVIDVTDEEEEEDEVMMAIDEYLNDGRAGGGVEPPPPESNSAQPPAPPAASPTPDPFAPLAQPASADAALSSPPTDKDKVNVSVTDMNSSFDSNSGYQASNSDTGGLCLTIANTALAARWGRGSRTKKLRSLICRQLIINAKPLELPPCLIKL